MQLGIDSMIDRLQTFKRVPSNYGFDPDTDVEPSVGGISATPRETNMTLDDQPTAQSHYFGSLEVFRHSNGNAEVTPVPTHFLEITHTIIKRHDVTLNGTLMTANPPPQISLTAGSKWNVYCKFETDEQGVITSAVTAHITANPVPDSTIHVPPSDSASGATGVYHKLIGIYDVPYSPADPIIFEPVSSPSWEVIDRKFSNLGSGAKVHKSTTKDKQEFRTLVGTDSSGGTTGTLKQGKVVFEQKPDTIEAKVFFAEDDFGGSGSGVTGEFSFVKNNTVVKDSLTFDSGSCTGNVPRQIKYQTPLQNGSYTAVDNANEVVDLVNANEANLKPDGKKVGFYPFYCVVAGEVGGTAIYCHEPKALALDASGNPTQIPSQVIDVTNNTQYNEPKTINGS